MLIRIEREEFHAPAPERACVELVEVISPRTNAGGYTPVEQLFAALVREHGISLEIAADATARRFFARTVGVRATRAFRAQVSAACPQVTLRPAVSDPAQRRADEQFSARVLRLRGPEYLPLRVLREQEVISDRAPQADPLLGVLAALGCVPSGWRALAQLVIEPAPSDWARRHLRRSVEHALEPERSQRAQGSGASSASGWGTVMMAAAFLAAVLLVPRVWALYLQHGWLAVVLLGVPAVAAVAGVYVLWLRLSDRPLYDLDLVKEKLNRPGARVEFRVSVFAPVDASKADIDACVDHIVAAYGAYNFERGNGFIAKPLTLPTDRTALCTPTPLSVRNHLPILTSRELAALWHPVQAADDIALVERTAARRFVPLPETVAEGGRIGVAEDGVGHSVEVHLSAELLRRHALLVAKTRKGKSGLLRRLWQQLVTLDSGQRPAVVLVDPHSDLAQAAIGLVPAQRHADVVYLDARQALRRPFGLNLLDVGLGWRRDQLVENALRVFRHEFDNFWGPRMELVFRMALLLLVDANQRIVTSDPTGGRDRQFTVLEVPRVLEDDRLRTRLLAQVADPQILAMWRTYFNPLDRRFRAEIINPVQTKTYKFAANLTARAIVGQSRSTIDPLAWIRDGAVVVVDVAKEQVGADIAGMIGGTLINLLALAVGQQAGVRPESRRQVALLVDEFHALPSADYEAFLAELAKYGASLVLATQSLGALDEVDPGRGLRHAVFGNVDHVFAFNCSAEDAALLAPELGSPIQPADLVELGDHQCYARLSFGGERLPAFHIQLDPPPSGDSTVRETLAACSAMTFGRDFAMVAADRAALLQRLEPIDGEPADAEHTGRATRDPENGRLPPASAGSLGGSRGSGPGRARNDKRERTQSEPPGATQQRLALGADVEERENDGGK